MQMGKLPLFAKAKIRKGFWMKDTIQLTKNAIECVFLLYRAGRKEEKHTHIINPPTAKRTPRQTSGQKSKKCSNICHFEKICTLGQSQKMFNNDYFFS